jgi:hypothetical protein
MHFTFICKACGLEKPANPHLKGTQQYCRDQKCQRARKRAWQKQKMATDPQYREKHVVAHKHWCKQYPLHRYQYQYRQNHPKYVEKNRERQKIRNQQRRKWVESAPNDLIVKMDAPPTLKSGTYLLTPYTMDASPKIVKMDTLLVQLQLLHQDDQPSLVPSR